MATKKQRFQQTADMIENETVDEYQARYDRKREEVRREAKRDSELVRILITTGVLTLGVVVLIAFLIGLIGNLHQYIETSSQVMKFLLEWVPRGLGVAVVSWLLVRLYRALRTWQTHNKQMKFMQAEIDAMNAATNRENLLAQGEYAVRMSEAAERTARAQQLSMTLPVDDQGNALYRDPYTGLVTPYIMQMREHPNLSSYHQSQKNDNTLQPGQQQAALPAATTGKPTVEELARLIEFNSFDVALGRSLTTSENLIASIEESHLKIIGGSRMGKSCGAGGILRQVEMTHDPRRLSFALLDLEYKTSRLFENSNHLITMGGNRERAMHAKTIEEVPQYLRYLTQELEKRDRMTYQQVAQRPHILIYLEEFLNLKRQLQNNFKKEMYQQFLTDFNTIATRGLKLGLHLMVCAQVDYADKDLRDSIAQFMGLNMAYGVKPEAARAAGFVNYELLQQNYANRQRGQFVMESFSGADIGAAPDFDVKAQIKALDARATVREELPYELNGPEVIGSLDEEQANRGAQYGDEAGVDTPFYGERVRITGELQSPVNPLSASMEATTETTTERGESEGPTLGPNDLEMNEIQSAQFRALYPVLGNIEKALRMIDSDKGDGKKLGQRYYTHARMLIRQYNLAPQKRGR